jgi:hypothetical protein
MRRFVFCLWSLSLPALLASCTSGGDTADAGSGGSAGPSDAGLPPSMQDGGGPRSGDGGTGGSGGAAGTGGTAGIGSSGEGGSAAGSGGSGGDAGAPVACETEEETLFSFFLISYEAIRRESGSEQGFGGDLGGISGADAICTRVALTSSPCAGNKTWRAFLSTTSEDAIDRIGAGPWHDRLGRLLANDIQELLNDRPPNAHPAIIDDFPNEFGVPNRNPDGTGNVDNHQILTGSGTDGRLYMQEPSTRPGRPGGSTACQDAPWTPEKATCWDWTVSDPVGCPRVGHSWPRVGSGIHWISVWNEGGCAPGVVLDDIGGPNGDPTVGSAGGYGGFYCCALTGTQ